MNDLDNSAFISLFREACEKCFGHPLGSTLSETESRLFSNKVFDQTGLVIGPKSIKNYSFHVVNPGQADENPSVATLDTLARYVLNAPYTDEPARKKNEGHFPYWFQYRNQSIRSRSGKNFKLSPVLVLLLVALLASMAIFWLNKMKSSKEPVFTDGFESVAEDSLVARGWFLKDREMSTWNRREDQHGYLTLFTLKGDNWPDSVNKPAIRNLLWRKISSDCFATELHLADFFPTQNWQQAGLLLMEDTNFNGKSLRLSLMYNDFSGGFPAARDIIVQAIVSGGDAEKPEEIIHQLLFRLDSTNEKLVDFNLQHSELRIEKHKNKFRLLFANSSLANAAFKEILSREIDIKPAYIGVFALKGFVDSAAIMPVKIDLFSYFPETCQ